VLGRYNMFEGVCVPQYFVRTAILCAYRNTFVLYLAFDQGWTLCLILDVVLHQALQVRYH